MIELGDAVGCRFRVRSQEFGDEDFIVVESLGSQPDQEGVMAVSLQAGITPLLCQTPVGHEFTLHRTSYMVLGVQRPDDPGVDSSSPQSLARSCAAAVANEPARLHRLLRRYPELQEMPDFWAGMGTIAQDDYVLHVVADQPLRAHTAVEPIASAIRFLRGSITGTPQYHAEVPPSLSEHWTELGTSVRYAVTVQAIRAKANWAKAAEIAKHERSLVLKPLLLLYLGQWQQSLSPSDLFATFHDALQEGVRAVAYDAVNPIDLRPLLHGCRKGKLLHCEGRCHEESGRIWCRGEWCFAADLESRRGEAPWQWTMQDILDEIGVAPTTKAVSKPEEYVTQFGGWVNRLNDIRAHLMCKHCNKIMPYDQDYAKNLAAYRATVVHCTTDDCPGCGVRVYLNHCWACHRIIDSSRDTPIQVENRYVCLACGSGPEDSQDYSQGDMCPKCGRREMQELGNRYFSCQRCDCVIRIPGASKLTGHRGARYREEQRWAVE